MSSSFVSAFAPTIQHEAEEVEEVTHRRGPTKAEWEQRRPWITRLYVVEGKRLKEVIAELKHFGHVAT